MTRSSHPALLSKLTRRLEDSLQRLEQDQQRRNLKTLHIDTLPQVVVQGRTLIDFSSNDYLGLSQHPAMKEAAIEAIERYGTSSRGSRLICGTLPLHQQLEKALIDWSGFEAALVFNSGYDANIGLLSAMFDRHDTLMMDRQAHASLIDGALLSRAKLNRTIHNDLEDLTRHLHDTHKQSNGQKAIVTEALFSMSGDWAPLNAILELSNQYESWLVVDEAHSIGGFGPHGLGRWMEELCQNEQPIPKNLIVIGTFSKALGSQGGFILCPRLVKEWLLNRSRSFIYTTALPPSVIGANLKALELIQSSAAERQAMLWKNIHSFRHGLAQIGGVVSDNPSPIVAYPTGSEDAALTKAEQLKLAGYFAVAIRPPTVEANQCMIRCSITAQHQVTQLHQLATLLQSS